MMKKTGIKTLVILRTDRNGKVLLSTVAIDAVKDQFPNVEISFVTSTYSKSLLEDRDNVKEIFTFDIFKEKGIFWNAIALAKKLKAAKFDTSVTLNPHKVLHLACFFAGIPLRIGYDRKWGFLLNKKIRDKRDEGKKHEIEYTYDLLALLGVTKPVKGPYLPVNKKAEESLAGILTGKGIFSDKKMIVIHPGSSNPSKIWSWRNYVELIKRIKKNIYSNVVLVGSEQEKDISGKIMENSGEDVKDLTGCLDIKELIAFLRRCDVFIGNDTGPMHMAAAVGIPVVAIFGRNIPGVSPVRWRPWGDKNIVLYRTMGCDPCLDSGCRKNFKCLEAVTVDAVFSAAKGIMKNTGTCI